MENWSENKKILITSIFLTVLTVSAIILSGHIETVFAVDDNVTVIVNISSVSQIEVLPAWLEWILCTPGADCGNKTIDVKNTGSINLTNIYASVNTTEGEAANPIPTGLSSRYSSGGLMAMANDTNLTWWFVGRQEWNISTPPSDYTVVSTISGNRSWGWFRNTSNNYLWDMVNGTATELGINGTCNKTGTAVRIETDADTGIPGTRTPTANGWSFTAATGGSQWGMGTMTSGPWSEYCIATYYTCEKLVVFKYDRGNNFGTACTKAAYMKTSALVPGDVVAWNIRAWVPQGIPAGNLTTAAITITAS